MRAVVTGGAGFIGSHLCEALVRKGYEVICVDDLSSGRRENLRPLQAEGRLSLRVADVCDLHALALPTAVDRIFHLACPASPARYLTHPIDTMRTAFAGSLAALELAGATGAPLVLASSSEVYGDPEEHPQREESVGRVDPIGARACYQEGKRAAEALATSFAREARADVRIARIFNTYGPRMRADDGRVVASFAERALRGQPLEVHGQGHQTRSFCYVSDLVSGLLALADRDVGAEPVNLGTPDEISILALARRVVAAAGTDAPLAHTARPRGDPSRRQPDIRRAHERLGFSPSTDLDTGLAKTLRDMCAR